jgi:hypothetical protein
LLTACGGKQNNSTSLLGGVSASTGDDITFGQCSSEDNTYTIYSTDTVEQKLVVGRVLDEAGKDLKSTDIGNGVMMPKVTYSGKALRYYYDVTNYSSAAKTVYIYIDVNGYIQPFKVDGEAQDGMDYTFSLPAHSEKKVGIRFTPIYSDDKKESFIQIRSNIQNTGLTIDFASSTNNVDAPVDLYLLSKDKSYDVEPKIKSDTNIKEYDLSTDEPDIFYVMKPTNGVFDWENGTTTIFSKDDQLCVVTSGEENLKNMMKDELECIGYLTIDDRLVKAFDGGYYVDWTMKKGKYYEIPFDKAAMPKNLGVHKIFLNVEELGGQRGSYITLK